MTVAYSRGANIRDNRPAQRTAADFPAFVDVLDGDRAPRKDGAAYVCGPLNGTGQRCAEGVQPRTWFVGDLDRIDRDAQPDVRLWLAGKFSGCAWPTHSSTPEAPRERFILELDRPATRAECMAVGDVLARDMAQEFGDAVQLDPCTYRGEQPVFLPPTEAQIARFFGEPLRVDAYLAAAQESPPEGAQEPGTKATDDELIARVRAGVDLHGDLRTLTGRWAAAGLGAEAMHAAAVGLLELARPARGKRVDEFANGGELAALIDGAVKKYAPAGFYFGDGDGTPQPLDIFRTIVAPALEPQDFAPVIADYAWPLAQAAGHDPSAYAMAALGAAAGAADDGLRLMLDPDTSWFESPRLWVLLLGSPGAAKTPAIRAALRPLFELHKALREAHARDVAGRAKDDPPIPAPALYSNDPTIEALSEVLVANPRGLLGVFEELDSWLGSQDAYRSTGGSKDRGEWLRLYDGGPHQVDRVKRGSVFVPNWGCSILGATTPAGLKRHARELPPDGLIQRFLPVLVAPMGDPSADEGLRATIAPARERFEVALRALLAAGGGVVRMTPTAARMFADRCRALRREIEAVGAMSEPMAGHIAKHAGMLARVALAQHALEHGGDACAVLLDEATMSRAERLLRKLTRHALGMYDALAGDAGSPMTLARAVGRAIVAGGMVDLTRRDLIHACRAFRDASEVAREAALRFLADAAWLTPLDAGRTYAGRAAAFAVHPAVHARFAGEGAALKARRVAVRDLLGA